MKSIPTEDEAIYIINLCEFLKNIKEEANLSYKEIREYELSNIFYNNLRDTYEKILIYLKRAEYQIYVNGYKKQKKELDNKTREILKVKEDKINITEANTIYRLIVEKLLNKKLGQEYIDLLLINYIENVLYEEEFEDLLKRNSTIEDIKKLLQQKEEEKNNLDDIFDDDYDEEPEDGLDNYIREITISIIKNSNITIGDKNLSGDKINHLVSKLETGELTEEDIEWFTQNNALYDNNDQDFILLTSVIIGFNKFKIPLLRSTIIKWFEGHPFFDEEKSNYNSIDINIFLEKELSTFNLQKEDNDSMTKTIKDYELLNDYNRGVINKYINDMYGDGQKSNVVPFKAK